MNQWQINTLSSNLTTISMQIDEIYEAAKWSCKEYRSTKDVMGYIVDMLIETWIDSRIIVGILEKSWDEYDDIIMGIKVNEWW